MFKMMHYDDDAQVKINHQLSSVTLPK